MSRATNLLAFVRMMLGCIVRCQEAVLQDDDETLTMIRHVVKQILASDSLLAAALDSEGELVENVKALLVHAVQTHRQALPQRSLTALVRPVAAAAEVFNVSDALNHEHVIANWFFTLSLHLYAAHPRAAEMLRARLLGLDSRTIAQRLELPPGLVRHVFDTLCSVIVFSQMDAGAAA